MGLLETLFPIDDPGVEIFHVIEHVILCGGQLDMTPWLEY